MSCKLYLSVIVCILVVTHWQNKLLDKLSGSGGKEVGERILQQHQLDIEVLSQTIDK